MLTIYKTLIDYYHYINGDIKLFEERLNKEGFKIISSGFYSNVMRLSDEPFVIKYIRNGGAALPTTRSKLLKRYFIGYEMLSVDNMVGVQKFVNDYYSLNSIQKKLVKKLLVLDDKYDIHIGNIGLLHGKPVIFDF